MLTEIIRADCKTYILSIFNIIIENKNKMNTTPCNTLRRSYNKYLSPPLCNVRVFSDENFQIMNNISLQTLCYDECKSPIYGKKSGVTKFRDISNNTFSDTESKTRACF